MPLTFDTGLDQAEEAANQDAEEQEALAIQTRMAEALQEEDFGLDIFQVSSLAHLGVYIHLVYSQLVYCSFGLPNTQPKKYTGATGRFALVTPENAPVSMGTGAKKKKIILFNNFFFTF